MAHFTKRQRFRGIGRYTVTVLRNGAVLCRRLEFLRPWLAVNMPTAIKRNNTMFTSKRGKTTHKRQIIGTKESELTLHLEALADQLGEGPHLQRTEPYQSRECIHYYPRPRAIENGTRGSHANDRTHRRDAKQAQQQ